MILKTQTDTRLLHMFTGITLLASAANALTYSVLVVAPYGTSKVVPSSDVVHNLVHAVNDTDDGVIFVVRENHAP